MTNPISLHEVIEPAGHYVLRYFFDGATGTCLWAGNETTVNAFDYPVDLDMLNLPDPVLAFGNQVISRWTGLADRGDKAADDPEYPVFRQEACQLLTILRLHLEPKFEILDESGITALRLSTIFKVVSGGQAGVDRAALDWAMKHGVPHGGWCPKGRLAEDGAIDSRYALQETESEGYRQRTRQNVIDSDGTLILNVGELSDGSLTTLRFAKRFGKPCLVVQLETKADGIQRTLEWLQANRIFVINVAGPRESKRPGIYQDTQTFLDRLFGIERCRRLASKE